MKTFLYELSLGYIVMQEKSLSRTMCIACYFFVVLKKEETNTSSYLFLFSKRNNVRIITIYNKCLTKGEER